LRPVAYPVMRPVVCPPSALPSRTIFSLAVPRATYGLARTISALRCRGRRTALHVRSQPCSAENVVRLGGWSVVGQVGDSTPLSRFELRRESETQETERVADVIR